MCLEYFSAGATETSQTKYKFLAETSSPVLNWITEQEIEHLAIHLISMFKIPWYSGRYF